MSIFAKNPFADIVEIKIGDIQDSIYLNDDTGETAIIRTSDGKTEPVLRIGGAGDKLESSAEREVDSTLRKTTKQEGLTTNPAVLFPSSFFTPIPPMLKGMFAGPLSIIDNPDLLLGLVAIVVATQTESESTYTEHYKNLPTKVIDNQVLEDKLFGA
jgi:hypothetical protein